MTYKIKKGVPIPKQRACKQGFEWGKMKVGDSIDISFEDLPSARSSASGYGRMNDMKFTSRRTKTGGTIWRIK